MKSITIIAEQLSDRSLTAALPAKGIASMVVSRNPVPLPDNSEMDNHLALRNPRRFSPSYQIELVVEDGALDSVFDGVSIAYGAGLFSDAEMWVNQGALASAA